MDIRRLDFDSKVEADLKEIKFACERGNTKLIGLVLAISAKTEGDYTAMGCDQIVPKPIIDSAIDAVIQNLYSKVEASNPEGIEILDTKDSIDKSLVAHNPKILLVEDNLINQEVALGLLEELNLTAVVVNNGKEAVDKIKATGTHTQFDLILMDCQMPVMDGYEATRRIRSNEAGLQNSSIPIIAMTANAMVGDKEKCLSEGMSDYISKPIDSEILNKKIKLWLSKGVDDKFRVIDDN